MGSKVRKNCRAEGGRRAHHRHYLGQSMRGCPGFSLSLSLGATYEDLWDTVRIHPAGQAVHVAACVKSSERARTQKVAEAKPLAPDSLRQGSDLMKISHMFCT